MTEKEKMLTGQLYDPGDKELSELRLKARKLARRYNNTDEDDTETAQAILAQLVPNRGAGTAFQPPVHFDYGCFTTFGQGCGTNFNFTALDCAPITIGDRVLFGPNCTLAAPLHPMHPEERSTYLEYAKPIVIGDDCWIASNVTICGGVTIGEGCVIGAGSVVTKDIPAHSLAAGNPCRVIRPITDEDRMGIKL